MLDWTDRHCRYFLRLITRHTFLYTEMVTTGAILHGNSRRFLQFDESEHPLALQLGGSDPVALAAAVTLANPYGYDEINLNVGCPSDRVQSGRFGACLMLEPELVARCVDAMQRKTCVPVTVKCRLGVDEQDTYPALQHFVQTVANAGCQTFIVHARKAWLQGLSPKENREIPPLCYDTVYQLKRDFPQLRIIINGGITELTAVHQHLQQVDGAMVGRVAYHSPYWLATVDSALYQETTPPPTREAIIAQFLPYVERQLAEGVALKHLTRHILGLFQGLPGARAWRRYLSEHAHVMGADVHVVERALNVAIGVSSKNLLSCAIT